MLFCSAGHNFNFHQAKTILKSNRVSELDFLENIAIFLNLEVTFNEKNNSILLSKIWKKYLMLIIIPISTQITNLNFYFFTFSFALLK